MLILAKKSKIDSHAGWIHAQINVKMHIYVIAYNMLEPNHENPR